MTKALNAVKTFHNVINGKTVPSSSGEKMDSYDPATGKVWATIPSSTVEDAEASVTAARSALPAWSSLPAMERANYLRRIGDLLSEYADELAELETKDNGWVIRETKHGLIPVLTSMWHDAASAAILGSKGETVQVGTNTVGYSLREPYGVVVGIIPWNSALWTFTIKAAYALAGGNTVIIKPSELASVASLRYGEIIQSILPPGVLNVVSGTGAEVGDALVRHPKVNKVSLTGSGNTAKAIAQSTSQQPKPMILELGGKSPNIVFEDADLVKAAQGVTLNGIFSGNAGQICVGGSRILIQRSILDEMIALMKEEVTKNISLGNTMDMQTAMGPVANEMQFKKVCSYIELGKQEGGEVIVGGRYGGATLLPNNEELADGYWVEPTLLKVDSNSLRICQEEIFGPVAVIIPFDTEEEAIAIANDTDYGLGAGVWTSNLDRAHRMIRSLESGNVWVNTYRLVGTELPFGGKKNSGYGTDSVLEYTREKTCYIQLS
ncbi:aldehyde dehydrogenase family protein [Bacillus massiliigorillae]|uniref:aldehyde dehydrogenase family protein n=1 Tax=Bacillus massiliigorillae TaxID=1243664 RepID=UPI0003A8F0F0|nr:aldehyde dehydrogenase family protein [Bacillus massiliigorillae]